MPFVGCDSTLADTGKQAASLPCWRQRAVAQLQRAVLDGQRAGLVHQREQGRNLARAVAAAYYASREALGFPMLGGADAARKAA